MERAGRALARSFSTVTRSQRRRRGV